MSIEGQLGFDFASSPASRSTDGETATAAGRLPGRGQGKAKVLQALAQRGPMNDAQIAAVTGLEKGTAAKRRKDCVTAGWVHQVLDAKGDPVTRQTNTGSPAFVWTLTGEGEVIVRRLNMP